MSRKTSGLLQALLVAVAIGIWADGSRACAQTFAVETARVEQRVLPRTLVAYGTVAPDPETVTTVAVPRPGIVTRVFVRLGQAVRAGDPLVGFESSPAALAEYDQARAALTFAKENLAHVERLFAAQLATRDEVAAARRQLADAEARLKSLEALGSQLRTQVLRAPGPGVIVSLAASAGSRLPADSTIAALAADTSFVVPLGVEPEDLAEIPSRAEVVLVSPWRPGLRIATRILRVHRMVNPQTGMIDAIVRVGEPDSRQLVIGMPMRGEIVLEQRKGLAVPSPSIAVDPQGSFVFVVRDGRAHRVPVTPLLTHEGSTLVAGKIAPGEEVVVGGLVGLHDGAQVRKAGP